MRVLLTGGGGVGSFQLGCQLWQRGHIIRLCDSDPWARPSALSPQDWHSVPPATRNGLTNQQFIDEIARLIREVPLDLVVPGVDEELRPLAYRMPKVLLSPSFDFIATHLDKLASMRALAMCGVAVPTTLRLQPSKAGLVWPSFPCIVKPREGRGSRHVAVVKSEAEGKAHVLLSGLPAIDFITQELLTGQEYTVGVLADRAGKLKAIVPVRVEQKRGITIRAVVDDDPAVHALAEQIHAEEPFSGYINIQCIKEADGRVRPFEINPRVSTTTCLAVAAGLDLIGGYIGGEALPNGLKPLTMRRYYETEFA